MRRSGLSLLLLLGLGACTRSGGPPPGIHQVWVEGRRLLVKRILNAPPLPALRRSPRVEIGAPDWAFGVVAHPALDALDDRLVGWFPGGFDRFGVSRNDPLWAAVPRVLYRRGPDGAWRRAGRYQPSEDPHGPIRTLLPLEGGAFLALPGGDWFRDGDLASPCACYGLDASGELRFQALVNPMEGASLPPRKPEPGDSSPWLAWYDELDWARSPRGLVIASSFGGCLSLLDPRDGHLLRHVKLPVEAAQRTFSLRVQPAPDGSFRVTAARAAEPQDAVRSPGGNLAAARLGLIEEDVEVRPVAFHLDPTSGALTAQGLPAGTPTLVSHAEYNYALTFLVDAQGQLELRRREMR